MSKAILKYIGFVLKQAFNYALILLLYPFIYYNRELIRKVHYSKYSTWEFDYLWGFLHDSLTDQTPCDYGDINFQKTYKKGDSKIQLYFLSLKWVLRNPRHNHYYSNGIQKGSINDISLVSTCHRDHVNAKLWRTIKFKFKDGVRFTPGDKHGEYVDFERSILGVQKYTFEMNGKKYFRYSKAVIIPIFKKYLAFEYKFGFESVNWAIQFHYNFRNVVESEYKQYLETKNKFITICL